MALLSNIDVCRLRMRAQRLVPLPDAKTDVALVVQELCGIQAQEPLAAALAIRARSCGLVAAAVEHAREHARTIIRTWGPRSTLHLLATADLDWLLPLLGPPLIAQGQRRRLELGLDEERCEDAIRLVRSILASSGPLTRAELAAQLAARGIQLEGQAVPHLLSRAALAGVICFGPDRAGEPSYVLLEDWVGLRPGATVSEDAACAELALRYLAAYGPATPQDQAAWSGLSVSKTRAAWQRLADHLVEVTVDDARAWMLKTHAAWLEEPPAPDPIVRLLPRFDVYLLGYRQRDFAVPPQYARRINAGGGILHPIVLVDGRAVGIWKSRRKKRDLDVLVEPFDELAPQVYQGLEAEVGGLARFLEGAARLEIARPQ